MELMLLRLFQQQIEHECQAILVAAQDLERALTLDTAPGAWIAIRNMLTAAANVSKALWGQGGRLADQREPLRASLEIDDTSPLRDVAMRNHFEHFDERLDLWWERSSRHAFVDMAIMPPEMIRGIDERDMFRQFDPETAEVVFWGERFDLRAIVSEAERLLPIVREEATKPHSEPPSSMSGGGQ